jgi:hypothetical protein
MTVPSSNDRKPSQTRTAVPIESKLDKKLVAYVAAAGAAGVGLLTGAQPAEAKVIYTKTNISIGESLAIDLNGDGVTDINFYIGGGGSNEAFLWAYLPPGNGAFGQSQANPMFFGVPVGPGEHFAGGTNGLAAFYCCSAGTGSGGKWSDRANEYMGIKFMIAGKPHFGWLRLTVKNETATITGYAYETIPNKSINTGTVTGPEKATAAESLTPATLPATLGLLARGTDGLAVWRCD